MSPNEARDGWSAGEPMPPSRQLVEVASWRLVAELVRRYPKRFTVIETHPGGGQYDCLSLYDRTSSSSLHHIDVNRVGSIHIWSGEEDHLRDMTWSWVTPWAEVAAADDSKVVLDRVCNHAHLPVVHHLPPSTPMVVAYRVISAFLTHQVFGRIGWECRNGYEDTSGYGGGLGNGFFAPFPAARQRASLHEGDDLLGIPATRFWFLIKDGEPQLAVEAKRGIVWDRDGRTTDLFAAYQERHRVWDAVWSAAGHLLP